MLKLGRYPPQKIQSSHLKAMLLVGIFPSQGLTTHNSFFSPCPETTWVLQMSSDADDRMGAKIKTLKKFPQTPNPPKNPIVDFWAIKFPESIKWYNMKNTQKILAKFSYLKKSWNQNFRTQKNPSIIPALEIGSIPLWTNINNYSFLNNTHIHQEKMFWE